MYIALYIAGEKGVSMVNQILTKQELMLSFLLQALVHMEFKEDHKQYVNQVSHAGEEKEQKNQVQMRERLCTKASELE